MYVKPWGKINMLSKFGKNIYAYIYIYIYSTFTATPTLVITWPKYDINISKKRLPKYNFFWSRRRKGNGWHHHDHVWAQNQVLNLGHNRLKELGQIIHSPILSPISDRMQPLDHEKSLILNAFLNATFSPLKHSESWNPSTDSWIWVTWIDWKWLGQIVHSPAWETKLCCT